jgi:hypothetical protein
MSLRDLRAFRRVVTELFGSGLHVTPSIGLTWRRNAEQFTCPVMRVTARPMIQRISDSEHKRARPTERIVEALGFRRYVVVVQYFPN